MSLNPPKTKKNTPQPVSKSQASVTCVYPGLALTLPLTVQAAEEAEAAGKAENEAKLAANSGAAKQSSSDAQAPQAPDSGSD